jgi:hypothetical protein
MSKKDDEENKDDKVKKKMYSCPRGDLSGCGSTYS